MNKNKNEKIKPIKCNKRLFIFGIPLIICFFIAISKLIEYQIIDYDKYDKIATINSQIKEIIPAARGEIVDRTGKALATNDLNLSLIVSENFPFKNIEDNKQTGFKKNQQGNEIILKVIKILDKEKIDWNEKSPISRKNTNNFLKDKEFETKKLKQALGQQDYATVKDSIKILIEKFNINQKKYTEKEIRDIAIFRANMLIDGVTEFGGKAFVIVKKVEQNFLNKIISLGNQLKGIQILETSKRVYPSTEFCSHFIGNTGPIYKEEYQKYKEKGYAQDAIVGKFGIEEKFDQELKATNGILMYKKNENDNLIGKYYKQEPKPGNTVVLTIDLELQKAVQKALEEFSRNRGRGKGATACVLDVKNGEVLALVSTPSYDINFYNSKYEEFKKQKNSPLKSRALVEINRPGSSFKPFIALTGLICGAITPSTKFVCRDGIMPHMGCAHQRHKGGMVDIYSAIEKSCNNYFYQVGNQIGIERIDKYAPYFGFGCDTGLEIYNSKGRITNPSEEFQKKYNTTYHIGDLWQTSIGQSETYVTILQQAICQMTIANKGKRLAAHIVKEIKNPNGKVIKKTKPKVMSKINIPDFAYDTVLKGMQLMAKSRPSLKEFDIAAKSGSPQYSFNKNLTNAAGVGFYPSQNPEIAFAVLVEDGRSGEDFFGTVVKLYNKLKKGEKLEQEEDQDEN